MNARATKLLDLGCEIARRELELADLRARFRRLVERGEEAPRPRGRPSTWRPLKERALEAFGADLELPAGELVHRLRPAPAEVVHAALSKLAADGLLVRVRWGVYRRPV